MEVVRKGSVEIETEITKVKAEDGCVVGYGYETEDDF